MPGEAGTAGAQGTPDDGAADGLRVEHVSARPLELHGTLHPLARGAYDPVQRRTPDGALWRTALLPTGPATYRLLQADARTVVGQVWGPGAREAAAALPGLLGEDDDAAGFVPPPQLAETHRRHPGLRVPRTGRVLESLVPAVLEQRVVGTEAFSAWRRLLERFGAQAPGPAPAGMRVTPDAATWAAIPGWDWHRAGVDPGRARTAVECARRAARLEECVRLPLPAAHARLQAVRGVGPWTAAEVAQRALGDADAVSVGDYHLAKAVIWSFDGDRGAPRGPGPGAVPADDARMLELLAPYAPHRYRVVLLLRAARQARPPRRGPRMPLQDHRRN
ncbi:DNA-3-methyladenine glycosylase [Cellulomonas sp. PhB143]|uniref:DNA-3-methyladenine glycosylase family protein n=1 Tax=Cellulomonas sp. PhB143 TaxID=2485186 RepID=UPI000FAB1C7B|nr:DNA-3-methyladenine glycosylase 2 family protein [Cellulomonas sp. PhB143]ROS79175.1 3-methyladenine DNA glycosylase/8-oxoguanine DNA glycosylase [Cellulomonas sp. PhB143]